MCGGCAIGAYETVKSPSTGWVAVELTRLAIADASASVRAGLAALPLGPLGRRRSTRGEQHRRSSWGVVAILAVLVPAIVVIAGPQGTVSATNLQTTVLSPVVGHISSNPAEPHWRPYGGDYSFDVHTSRTRRPVYARFRNTNGTLSLTVAEAGRACASGRFQDGGDKVVLNVLINGNKVGTVTYSHLTNLRYRSGAVPVGAHIGDIATRADGLSDSSCWRGEHVHVEPRNDVRYGCYIHQPLGTAVGHDTPLGIVGGEHATTVNRRCGAGVETAPAPSPPPTTIAPPPATPTWAGAFVSQSAWLDQARTRPWDLTTAYPSQTGWLEFRVRNTGTATWSRTGTTPVRIGTAEPHDRASSFRPPSGWLTSNRPAGLLESTVAPGGTGTFRFPVQVPAGSSTVREHFRLVADGAAWFGPVMWRDFVRREWSAATVDVRTFRDPNATTSWDPARAIAGEVGWVRLRVRNTGSATWSSGGATPVRVGTIAPNNRHSALAHPSWIDPGRPAAVNPSTVPPGAIGTFLFPLQVPDRAGTWVEAFGVVVDGRTWLPATAQFTVSATTVASNSPLPEAPPVSPPSPSSPGASIDGIELSAPIRLVDTRTPAATIDGRSSGSGAIEAGSVLELVAVGRGGLPVDAAAIALNLTAVEPVTAGFLTVWPCGGPRPTASNLNVGVGDTRANAVVVAPGTDGKVCVFSSTRTHLVVDANGIVPPGSPVKPLRPGRLLDTRTQDATVDGQQSGGGILEAGTTVEVDVAGRAGVPTDASTALLNLTVVDARGPGWATVWPCGQERPVASNLNFTTGSVVANAAVSGIGRNGKVCVHTSESTHLLVDVTAHAAGGTALQAMQPERLLETRSAAGTIDGLHSGGGTVPAGTTVELDVAGRGELPMSVRGVVLTTTAIHPDRSGHLTVFPCGSPVPNASSLNFSAGDVVPNAVLTALGTSGRVCLYTSATMHLVVDVAAYIP